MMTMINCFSDDDVFAAQSHSNPSRIVNHDWKKLRMMQKSVNSDYKNALTCFTVSGTHNSNFFGFCAGKLEPAIVLFVKAFTKQARLNFHG